MLIVYFAHSYEFAARDKIVTRLCDSHFFFLRRVLNANHVKYLIVEKKGYKYRIEFKKFARYVIFLSYNY